MLRLGSKNLRKKYVIDGRENRTTLNFFRHNLTPIFGATCAKQAPKKRNLAETSVKSNFERRNRLAQTETTSAEIFFWGGGGGAQIVGRTGNLVRRN